jgi:hypothetical protein
VVGSVTVEAVEPEPEPEPEPEVVRMIDALVPWWRVARTIKCRLQNMPWSSNCGIHQPMPCPSTMRPAIDPSATRRLWSSTCGTLPFINRIRKPLRISFSALSQRLIMTFPSHQLRMPTCGDKKDRPVAAPRQTMRGTDITTRCKANCACGMVQRTI